MKLLKNADLTRSCGGSFLFLGMFFFALVGLVIGWLAWDLRTGAIIALVIFGVFFAVSMLTFTTIENPGAVVASLPMALSLVYNMIPNAPTGVDNTIVEAVCGLLTYFMWKRRDDRFPTWALVPFGVAAAYALLGGFIPGPFDETLVTLASVAIVVYKYRQNRLSSGDIAEEGEE